MRARGRPFFGAELRHGSIEVKWSGSSHDSFGLSVCEDDEHVIVGHLALLVEIMKAVGSGW